MTVKKDAGEGKERASLIFNPLSRFSIPWYMRLVLWFIPSKVSASPCQGFNAAFGIVYKKFLGVIYVMGVKE